MDRAIGEKTLLDVKVPILTLTLAGNCIIKSLVVPFYQSICLRMVESREVVLNFLFLEKLRDEIVLEFQSVVSLNMARGTIVAVNVGIDEVGNFCTSFLRKRFGFRPTS